MDSSGSLRRVQGVLVCGDGVTAKYAEKLSGELSIPVTALDPLCELSIQGDGKNGNAAGRWGNLGGVAVGLAARKDCHI